MADLCSRHPGGAASVRDLPPVPVEPVVQMSTAKENPPAPRRSPEIPFGVVPGTKRNLRDLNTRFLLVKMDSP